MKNIKSTLLIMLVILSTSIFAQTYTTPPLVEDFEDALTGEWYLSSGTGLVSVASPKEGSQHLMMDGNDLDTAIVYLNLDSTKDYTLEFWHMNIEDEKHTGDSLYFYDTITDKFIGIFNIWDISTVYNGYEHYKFNINSLAAFKGIAISDSFAIMFTHEDNNNWNHPSFPDGFTFDSVAIYETPPLTAGTISGVDTICYADIGKNITLASDVDASGGVAFPTYYWESTFDFITWTNIGKSSTTDTTFASPSTTTFYRRAATDGVDTVYSNSVKIAVDDDLTLSVFTNDTSLCVDESAITILGFPTTSGGSYNTFTGLTDNNNGTASLDPGTAGLGSHNVVYNYSTDLGCLLKDSLTVVVNDTPSVSFTGLPTTMNSGDAPVTLTGIPSGGTFTGLGVSGDVFYPSIAPKDVAVKVYYTFTNAAGCTSDAKPKETTVTDGTSGGINSSLLAEYCSDFSNTVALKGVPDPGWTAHGWICTSSSGFTAIDADDATFAPGSADLNTPIEISFVSKQNYSCNPYVCGSYICGSYVCVIGNTGSPYYFPIFGTCYNYCDSYCWNTCTKYDTVTVTTTVHSLPNLSIPNLASSYCKNASTVNLQGNFGGTDFVSSVPAALSGTVFNPAHPSLGSSVTITYSYTDANFCANSIDRVVTIDTVPVVSITGVNPGDEYCVGDAADVFTGYPVPTTTFPRTYGRFTTDPYVNWETNTSTFDPSIVGTRQVVYQYYDSKLCTASDTVTITTHALPTVSFKIDLTTNTRIDEDPHCTDAPQIDLAGNYSGGTYTSKNSNASIIDFSDGTANFYPTLVPQNTYDTVTYTYTDGNGCTNSQTQYPYVKALPSLNIIGLAPEYCESVTSAAIFASESPAGGVGSFTGSGVGVITGGDTYHPNVPGLGIDTVKYNYTDLDGCKNDTFAVTTINSLPTLDITGIDSAGGSAPGYCEDFGIDILTGVPTVGAGNFFGEGITNFGNTAQFNTTDVNDDTARVYYSYTDANNCFNQIYKDIPIRALPVVSFKIDLTVNTRLDASKHCEDASTINIVGSPTDSKGVFTDHTGYGSITDNNDGTGVFDPTQVTKDDTAAIVYKYTDIYGCIDSVIHNPIVKAVPTIVILDLDSAYCESVTDDVLNVSISTSGGVGGVGSFIGSGIGVITGNTYHPNIPPVGIDTVKYTYTDNDGCTNDTFDVTIIDPLPVMNITGIDSAGGVVPSYCEDAGTDIFTGIPTGNAGTFSGYGITDNGDGTAIFDPTFNIALDTAKVLYEFVDTNGCYNSIEKAIVIHDLPIIQIFGQESEIMCADQTAPDDMQFSPKPSTGIDGAWLDENGDTVTANIQGLIITDFANGEIILEPDSAMEDTTFTIFYEFTDNNTCVNSDSFQIFYKSLPIVEFVYLDSVYCIDDAGHPLEDTLSAFLGQAGNGWYKSSEGGVTSGGFYNPILTRPSIDSAIFTTVDTIIYRFTTPEGCWAEDTQSTRILELPEVNFEFSGFCNNDTIFFYDSTFISPFDSITQWVWDYDNPAADNDTIINSASLVTQNGKSFYLKPSKSNVELEVFTVEGCYNNKFRLEIIGAPPLPDFTWDNICFGDSVHFEDLSTVVDAIDPIVDWRWDLGDGTAKTDTNPGHIYTALNSYDVQLHLTTSRDCIDSLTRTIHIRPVISTYPYFEDFENGEGGWFGQGTIDLKDSTGWELGVANGHLINDSLTGNNSYMTTLDTNYYKGEVSFVDGACFDMSSLEKPMIVFNKQANLNGGTDGVNFQYTTDNGITWKNLGGFDKGVKTGINWYDAIAVAAQPGQNLVAWSEGVDSNWVEARHALDEIPKSERGDVRLRFTFGSTPTSYSPDIVDGFAFDNIWIGERSRTVLFEHFTNSSSSLALSTDSHIDAIVDSNSQDVIDIQYHISTGEDQMNKDNPADADARGLYYGIFESGIGVMDGNQYNNASNLWTERHMILRSLEDAQFDINLQADINSGKTINVDATIIARDSLAEDELSVQIVVVEKQIKALTGNNTDDEFQSVMKSMLPDAVGNRVVQAWSPGDSLTFSEGWVLDNIYDQSQLQVVVFVQNNTTKEVYQAASIDSFLNSTGIDEVEFSNNNLLLYPNPSSGKFNMLFSKPLTENTMVKVMDLQGKEVLSKQLFRGVNASNFDLSEMANGIYLVNVINSKGSTIQKVEVSR